uniref:Fas cell surface death receptor n=1 Tax=Crocodylus porosus TaxID=8502 RepID=A0A7M4FKR6_CROPO
MIKKLLVSFLPSCSGYLVGRAIPRDSKKEEKVMQKVFSWSTGSQHESDNTLAVQTAYKRTAIKRIIAKREIICKSDQYRVPDGKTCCKKCPPGTFKEHDCTTGNNTPTCSPCSNGVNFMDKHNYLEKCRKCQLCDSGHGLEVEDNCTTTHNTKCRCKSGYFCIAGVCTDYCEPCDKCENGIAVPCTPTSNTVCKGNFWWTLLALILLLPLAGMLCYCFWLRKNYKNLDINQQYSKNVRGEENPLLYTDIDLSPHISSIAEGMTLPQVKTFVRKHLLTEPTIERVIQDNQNDTAEQKIKLLLS